MNTFARSFALLSSFALVAVGCGQDQSDDATATEDAVLTCGGFHHGDPGRHRGHHHGRHHHHHDGGGGSTGTGGTGGQPHLTGMAGTTGMAGSMGMAGTTGMAGSTGSGGTGGAMVDPRCVPLAGIVSWWHADGDYDDAVGSNDGTTGGSVTFGPGIDNQAFSLSGASGSVVNVADD